MINVITVHWQTAKWIDVQLSYLERHIDAPFRMFASLNGIEDAAVRGRFHLAVELPGTHAEKLNELANAVLADSDPSDVLLFVDGDAFPVRPLFPWITEVLQTHPLVAVRRDENFSDPQPHPCFCATTTAFWAEIGGDWRPGHPWINSVGVEVNDVGGTLLHRLEDSGIDWLPLLRTNTANPHQLLFGVYAHRVYHHGAGFRTVPTRVDLHRQATLRPSLEQPSLGTLRAELSRRPSMVLGLRPRHWRVGYDAVRRTATLRRQPRRNENLNSYEENLFDRLSHDPDFYRALDHNA
jgi:hypothetical protein